MSLLFPIAVFLIVFGCAAAAWLVLRVRRELSLHNFAEPQHPHAFGYKMSWIAVRTRNTGRLVELLGIAQPRPTSWSDGIATIYSDRKALNRVFISPPLENWSFVVSLALPYPVTADFVDRNNELLVDLSNEFGEAHYYLAHEPLGLIAWSRFHAGTLRRSFAIGREGLFWNRGDISVAERNALGNMFRLADVESSQSPTFSNVSEQTVLDIADAWSIDPTCIDNRYVSMKGVGYVAAAPESWKLKASIAPAA